MSEPAQDQVTFRQSGGMSIPSDQYGVRDTKSVHITLHGPQVTMSQITTFTSALANSDISIQLTYLRAEKDIGAGEEEDNWETMIFFTAEKGGPDLEDSHLDKIIDAMREAGIDVSLPVQQQM